MGLNGKINLNYLSLGAHTTFSSISFNPQQCSHEALDWLQEKCNTDHIALSYEGLEKIYPQIPTQYIELKTEFKNRLHKYKWLNLYASGPYFGILTGIILLVGYNVILEYRKDSIINALKNGIRKPLFHDQQDKLFKLIIAYHMLLHVCSLLPVDNSDGYKFCKELNFGNSMSSKIVIGLYLLPAFYFGYLAGRELIKECSKKNPSH